MTGIIAHLGFNGLYPENTRRAFEEALKLDIAGIKLTALATPGHTIGALSWQWQSCDAAGCLTLVYADSLSPVSADAYRFTDHPDYVAMFRRAFPERRGRIDTAAITGAQCVPVPHSGHLPHLERPEEFDTLLLDFLRHAKAWLH